MILTTWLLLGKSYSHSRVWVSNVCLKSSPLFSMWLAETDSHGPTRSFHICWRIYDQVVSGSCQCLGNTAPPMEKRLKLSRCPVILPVVQNKLARNLTCVLTNLTVQCAVLQKFTVYIQLECQPVSSAANFVIVLPNMCDVTEPTDRRSGVRVGVL